MTARALVVLAGAMLVLACRSAAPAASLPGTSWLAEDIDGGGVLDRVQSTLVFDGPDRIAGRAACNQFFGTVVLGESSVSLKPAGMTRMACPPAVMEQESRFLAALGAVTAFRREGDHLLLVDGSGRVRVRLSPLAPGSGAPRP